MESVGDLFGTLKSIDERRLQIVSGYLRRICPQFPEIMEAVCAVYYTLHIWDDAKSRQDKEAKKQFLNNKLSRKQRPDKSDLVNAKIIFPDDYEVLEELRRIALLHRRMSSAILELANRLPFEDETNLQVAQTMMRHINATEDDINLRDSSSSDDEDAECEDETEDYEDETR